MTDEDIKHQLKGYLYTQKDQKFSFEFSPIKLPFAGINNGDVIEKEYENFNECIVEHFK